MAAKLEPTIEERIAARDAAEAELRDALQVKLDEVDTILNEESRLAGDKRLVELANELRGHEAEQTIRSYITLVGSTRSIISRIQRRG